MTSNLHIQILGVMSVKWQDKRSSLQQVCKTLLKLKPKEGSFEKADSCPCDKYANCGTSYRPGNNPSLCVLLWPCIASAVSTICQVPQEESCLPESQVTGLPNLVLAFYPEAIHDPAPAPQLPQFRRDLACLRDPVEDTPSFTPDTGPLILVHLKILKQSMIQLQPILARV